LRGRKGGERKGNPLCRSSWKTRKPLPQVYYGRREGGMGLGSRAGLFSPSPGGRRKRGTPDIGRKVSLLCSVRGEKDSAEERGELAA